MNTKKMEFNPDSSQLQPGLVDDKKQKEQKMVDMAVIKRGLNYHGTNKNDLD